MSRLSKLLIAWLVVLTLLFSALSLLRHEHFQSGGFDLGVYDQTIWKYSRFLSPYNTIKDRFILGDHLNLTIPFLAPLFWLWEDVRVLLLFQAFWLSFSSLAIYKLCRLRKFSPLTSFNLSFLYSLFYGIQFAVFFDFHAVIIGVGLISWLVYFLESKQKKLFWLSLALLLLTQENMGLALASLGLFYFFKKEYRSLSIAFILGGLAWSLLAAKIIASFSPVVGFQYWPELSLDPLKIGQEFFNAEEKRLVWLYSFSWFSFLPLLSPGAVLAVVLNLAQYFVTGPEFARMWSPFMHHRAILAPFLVLGVLDVLRLLERIKKRWFKPRYVSILMIIIAIGLQYFFHFPLNKLSKPIYWQSESWMDDNRALFQFIPKEASLATQQSLVPHLSHRQEIYIIWPREHDFDNEICGQRSCWWLDFGGQPEYLVVDLHPHQWLTQLLETSENFGQGVKNMEKAGKITLEKEINDAKLYRINY
jgi:uncharacterized membrane protein